jgi:hypothetical protein
MSAYKRKYRDESGKVVKEDQWRFRTLVNHPIPGWNGNQVATESLLPIPSGSKPVGVTHIGLAARCIPSLPLHQRTGTAPKAAPTQFLRGVQLQLLRTEPRLWR